LRCGIESRDAAICRNARPDPTNGASCATRDYPYSPGVTFAVRVVDAPHRPDVFAEVEYDGELGLKGSRRAAG
jgi:hypothetical protein